MSLKNLILAVIASCATPAFAEPIEADVELGALYTPGGLTADAAALRARPSSPAVWRKVAELESAVAALDAAKLRRIPQVTTKLSYTRLSSITESTAARTTGFSFPQLLDNYAAQTQVVVPLSDYALRHPNTIGAARLTADAAAASKQATELGVAIAARRAYYEWIRARLQLVISRRQLVQVQGNVVQLRDVVAAGRLPRAELLRIESQQAEVEQLVDRLRTVTQLREEALRILIGARPDEQLAIGEDLRAVVQAPAPTTLDDLGHRAIAQRLEIRALGLAIAANEQRRQAERASQAPRLSTFGTVDYANPNQRVFPQEDRFAWSWSAGLQLTWSLDEALISRATRRRLAADGRALEADREALARDTRLAAFAAQQDIANAERAIATTRKGLDAAEESYRVRRALLAADRLTAIELVDAETDLTRARIAALDARIDLRIAIAELDHAIGNDR